MDLKRISIKNYRQYRDVKIEFDPNPDKNFTIIQGNNGTGKTTFLNALSWCLYGEEIHDYRDDSSMDICNNKSLKLADNHSNIDVVVEMEFLDDDKKRLIFRRSKTFHKTNDDLIAGSIFGDEFVVIQPDSKDPEPNPNIAHYMVENKKHKQRIRSQGSSVPMFLCAVFIEKYYIMEGLHYDEKMLLLCFRIPRSQIPPSLTLEFAYSFVYMR